MRNDEFMAFASPADRDAPGAAVTPAVPPPAPPVFDQQVPLAASGRQRRRSRKQRAGAAGAGGATLAAKGGLLAKLAVVLKAGALLGKFKLVGAMFISVLAYSLFFGWPFAVGFVVLIFIHEMGHVVVLRAQGVKASAPMFIPFLGAFIKVKGEQRSVGAEARSAMAGPAFGLAASALCLELANITSSPLLHALAYVGFFLNLFNLAPALPLDGGRVAGALHPAVWFVGLGLILVLDVRHFSPILTLILILGGVEAVRRFRRRKDPAQQAYFAIPGSERLAIGAAYIGLLALCAVGMIATYVPRTLS